jgi:succinate-semialdehyde dehydrogenase / glutarate-semialdehyde dehydrogenase
MAIATINPATGELLASLEPLSDSEVEEKLSIAMSAFRAHRYSSFTERRGIVLRVADVLEAEKEQFSRLITTEMGKPISAARQEIEKSLRLCHYYAEEAENLLSDENVLTGEPRSYLRCEPLGPILIVMPWNFPFWQVIRAAVPALMAGNVVLLKHAPNVPQCAVTIETVFRRAGAQEGVFQTLLIESHQVGALVADSRVAAVSLTGSKSAGSCVGAQAGRHIKKSVLELGGSDPFIVMPSADIAKARHTAVRACTKNAGQSCVAARRIIIDEKIYDDFEARFIAEMKDLRIGDPFDEATVVGPLASQEVLSKLETQLKEAVSAGARLLLGGKRLNRPGFYYSPSVLSEIPAWVDAYREEVFGPVALLFRARNIEEAIRLANDTPFGLGASVWTNDEDECERFVRDIEAGSVFVNGMVASDVRFPFGGVKRSGYGREMGLQGIREFVNLKTIRIQNWR